MAEFRKRVPIVAIDEPTRAARSEIADEGLASLTDSIRQLGVLQPLLLLAVDDGRFEVIAGHRRFLAARAAGRVDVPALVYRSSEELHSARLHENLEREELHPCDEGVYYLELMEELGGGTEAVAAKVRRSVDYVERRMNLVRGDPEIFKALREGRILLGVAEAFNRIAGEDDRRYYLDYAIRGGCSLRQAREWVEQANGRAEAKRLEAERQAAQGGPSPPAPPAATAPGGAYMHLAKPHELSSGVDVRECLFCGEQHPEWQMYRKHVCSPCADRVLVEKAKREAEHGA